MRISPRSSVLLTPLLIVLIATPTLAQWRALGNTISTAILFPDGAGNCIVAGSTKIDASSTVLWSTPAAGFTLLGAAPDRSGGAVRVATTASGVDASRVNAAGTLLWTTNIVNYGTGGMDLVAFTTDAVGNAFMVWRDYRTAPFKVMVQKVDPSGVPQWQANGVLVTNTPVGSPLIGVSGDENGGCFVVWEDFRSGVIAPSDLYMQRVTSGGSMAWTANGLPIASAANTQNEPWLCTDGAGGVLVSWLDRRAGDKDVYMQRVDVNGGSLWAPNGVPICAATGDQGFAAHISDGAGGAFVTWSDSRAFGATNYDVYVQRVNGSGAVQWTSDGLAVCTFAGSQSFSRLALDGSGGVFVAWSSDAPAPTVQRLDGSGNATWNGQGRRPLALTTGANTLAAVAPDGTGGAYVIQSTGVLGRVLGNGQSAWTPNWGASAIAVEDVPGDEGGWVTVSFDRAVSESDATPPVNAYSVWAKRPGSTATGPARLIDPHGWLARSAGTPTAASYLSGYTDFPAGTWDALGYVPTLSVVPRYSVRMPTHADLPPGGPANSEFVVLAHCTIANLFVVSAGATGYSVDNLPPGPPQNLAGGILGSTSVQLHWTQNPEADLWHYAVHRGTSTSFVPSAENRIGQPTANSFQDDAYEEGVSHYKVCAIDRHGNSSTFALLTPQEITSVPPGVVPGRTYLAPARPNPFRGQTAMEYGLARTGRVALSVFDANGRHVARLVDEVREPGVYRAVWQGLDQERNRVSPGVYLVRLSVAGVQQNAKIVMTE